MRVVAKFLVLALLVSSSVQAAECLKDGADVTFIGRVSRETFPGPPNYTSIDNGDKPETVWILTIKDARCVVAESMESGKRYEVAKTASRFQLAFEDPSAYAKQKNLVEAEARITGQLFVATTGHHHTKALVAVKTISAAR